MRLDVCFQYSDRAPAQCRIRKVMFLTSHAFSVFTIVTTLNIRHSIILLLQKLSEKCICFPDLSELCFSLHNASKQHVEQRFIIVSRRIACSHCRQHIRHCKVQLAEKVCEQFEVFLHKLVIKFDNNRRTQCADVFFSHCRLGKYVNTCIS